MHGSVLSYRGDRVPQEWNGLTHLNRKLLTQESVFLTEEFLSVSFCPTLLPLSISIFLNDLYVKLAEQFYDKGRETMIASFFSSWWL